ncbi:hypothetical protein [Megasphaera sp. DISK 18]|uniref:hypothetical protein n=1 Tax=Megasphaera sp. DISK 18 TaxID=1776081 RepID=UPI000806FC5A|nr:hypothetical protein [Megasphaera sp. DISK 18]OBZ32495.1 hypothetical protein A0U42_10335 [Megasphaera sp. DISK 18]
MDRDKLSVPQNTSLPFFAYGFFKPNELAYNQISPYSEGQAEEAYVYGRFYEKDGVPILRLDDRENERNKVMGAIITFNRSKQERAYKVISDMEPPALYRWEPIRVFQKGQKKSVNILVYSGNDMINEEIPGAEPIEGYLADWRCRDDPLMGEGMNYLRRMYFNVLVECRWGTKNGIPILSESLYENIFQMQMAYVFLWTIMDRYKSLKYGLDLKIGDGNRKLESDDYWQDAIRQIKVILRIRPIDLIRGGINSREVSLRTKLMGRFYSIRCNAVHRGKVVPNDAKILTQAFLLLYPIVSYIITCDVHHEEREAKKQLEVDCRAIRSVFRLKR